MAEPLFSIFTGFCRRVALVSRLLRMGPCHLPPLNLLMTDSHFTVETGLEIDVNLPSRSATRLDRYMVTIKGRYPDMY